VSTATPRLTGSEITEQRKDECLTCRAFPPPAIGPGFDKIFHRVVPPPLDWSVDTDTMYFIRFIQFGLAIRGKLVDSGQCLLLMGFWPTNRANEARMRQYLDLLSDILEHGFRRAITGTGTKAVFGRPDSLSIWPDVSRWSQPRKPQIALHFRHELLWFFQGRHEYPLSSRIMASRSGMTGPTKNGGPIGPVYGKTVAQFGGNRRPCDRTDFQWFWMKIRQSELPARLNRLAWNRGE